MSETARIESIAELRAFRVALIKFVDACNVALGDAESDMQRTMTWLERDQLAYWTGQLAKRAEIVTRAKEAVRMKKLFKSPTGAMQSAVEEEKALRVAIRMHEEAEQKIVACKRWARRLQKEIMMYKGGVTRFTSVLGGDIPRALARLDVMSASLEDYATLAAGAGAGQAGGASTGAFGGDAAGGSMARSADAAPAAAEPWGGIDVAALRENVPPPEVRAGAPYVDVREETWVLPPLSVESRKAMIGLGQSGQPLANDDTVIVAKGAWSAPRIYLERRAPAGPHDSGWYLASTETAGIIALNAVPVRDLLEIRPDFRELLAMPEGFLLLIGDDGIRSIFTPRGEDLWAEQRAAAAKALETEAADNPPLPATG
jgi:hypothetical protein